MKTNLSDNFHSLGAWEGWKNSPKKGQKYVKIIFFVKKKYQNVAYVSTFNF